jgi:hypothetical protein
MTDMMTEVALMTGKHVMAGALQMIEEPMILVGLRMVKEEEVGVAILEGVGEEEEMMEEGVVKKAMVGLEEVNQEVMEGNPPE